MQGRTTTRLLALVGMVLAVVGGVLAAPRPAVAEGDVTVVWPSVERFNPDLTAYEVAVTGADVSDLRFVVGGVVTAVEADGSTAVDFPAVDERYPVVLERCAPECVELDRRFVMIYRALSQLRVGGVVARGPGYWSVPVSLQPSPVTDVAVRWELRSSDAEDADVLDAGTGTADIDYYGADLPMDTERDLAHGERLYYVAELVAETADYGTLSGRATQWIEWDEAVDASVVASSEEWYSRQRDRPRLTLTVQGSDWNGATATVLDASGAELGSFSWREMDGDPSYTWDGVVRDDSGGWHTIRAEGHYTVRVDLYDQFGNEREFRFPLRIIDDVPRAERWRRTVSPARTLLSSEVGRCSTLRRPAVGGDRGSLGFYSQTRCRRADDSVVSTVHGLRLPSSLPDDGGVPRFDRLRVSVLGGRARGEQSAYLVLFYWDGDTWRQRTVLDGDRGAHPGPLVRRTYFQHADDGSTWVYWSVGLTEGSRYDVQGFEVAVTRWVVK